MISKTMTDALNRQINAEVYSAYLYQSMAAYATYTGMKGVANWLNVQAKEEMAHAQIFYQYINSQGEQVILYAIEQPPSEFESVGDIFEQKLAHEKKITGLINDLANLAQDERDHATANFLQWFVDEQVEEEGNARDILDKFKLTGGQGNGLFMIDSELAARVFVMPAKLSQG